MDHRRLRFEDFPTSEPRRLPGALRDRLRLAILGGLVLMAVGAALPWLRLWMPGRGFFEVSGFERAGDAGLVLELGLVILALTWSDQAWHSRTPVLVAGPFLAGAAALLVLRTSWSDGESYIRSLDPGGGSGSFLPWFWLTVAGAAIVTAGGAVAAWRARDRVSYRARPSLVTLAGVIGGIGGAVGGFIGGTVIADMLAGDDIAWVSTSVLVVLSIALGFVGAWLGATIGAWIGRSIGGDGGDATTPRKPDGGASSGVTTTRVVRR